MTLPLILGVRASTSVHKLHFKPYIYSVMQVQDYTDSATYRAFMERMISLKEQHLCFMRLAAGRNGAIADGYNSLAANTLTTLAEVDHLFNIYKLEFCSQNTFS